MTLCELSEESLVQFNLDSSSSLKSNEVVFVLPFCNLLLEEDSSACVKVRERRVN